MPKLLPGAIVARRMRELAYLNAGIKITLSDLRPDPETGKTRTEVFHAKDGLKEFVRYVDRHRQHGRPQYVSCLSQGLDEGQKA